MMYLDLGTESKLGLHLCKYFMLLLYEGRLLLNVVRRCDLDCFLVVGEKLYV